jgi:hypothetical protein
MTDRRGAHRFQLCRSTSVQIGLLQDVMIQSSAGDHVTVLTSSVPPASQRLLLQLVRADGEVACLSAHIVRTAPVVESGDMKFRLDLHVAGFAALLGLSSLPFLG